MADTNAGRSGGNMGITSPLKEASTKGIISGKGMLSFWKSKNNALFCIWKWMKWRISFPQVKKIYS